MRPSRQAGDLPPWTIRDARPEDADFLTQMLGVAADWRSATDLPSAGDVLARPGVGHYVVDWPRPGDTGVVAETDRPAGAAWYRFLPPTDPGYGYVDSTTPELTLAVVGEYRGQGLGGALLAALLRRGRAAGVPRISLSVEDGNPARRLYERLGFAPVRRCGNSTTMICTLARLGGLAPYEPSGSAR